MTSGTSISLHLSGLRSHLVSRELRGPFNFPINCTFYLLFISIAVGNTIRMTALIMTSSEYEVLVMMTFYLIFMISLRMQPSFSHALIPFICLFLSPSLSVSLSLSLSLCLCGILSLLSYSFFCLSLSDYCFPLMCSNLCLILVFHFNLL